MVFIAQLVESLNRANRQPSNGLKFNRHRQKGFFFYRQQSKRFKVLQILPFQLILMDFEHLGVTGKPRAMFSKTLSKRYNTLQLSYSVRVS